MDLDVVDRRVPGSIRGGRVLQTLFPGRWLRFAYLENVIQV